MSGGAMKNSRWYSGAGIYRDVTLLKSERCHIEAGQRPPDNTRGR